MQDANVNPVLDDLVKKAASDCLDVFRRNAEIASLIQPTSATQVGLLTQLLLVQATLTMLREKPDMEKIYHAYKRSLAELLV